MLGGLATLLMVIARQSAAILVWNDVGTYAGVRQALTVALRVPATELDA